MTRQSWSWPQGEVGGQTAHRLPRLEAVRDFRAATSSLSESLFLHQSPSESIALYLSPESAFPQALPRASSVRLSLLRSAPRSLFPLAPRAPLALLPRLCIS
eukprot:2624445-Rhodomonas_salina.1